jgi:hypothetical protein
MTMNAGWHWRASVRRAPRYVNIPYWPHRILVVGWGRLDRRGMFHDHQPCLHRMTLRHCCPGRTS